MYTSKDLVRELIKKKCQDIDKAYFDWSAVQVLNYAKPIIDGAKNIAIYRAYLWELNLQHIIQYALDHEKEVYQPIAFKHTKQMLFDKYLAENSNVFYPEDYKPIAAIEWYNLDLIIMPVMAVDINGNRLGKGGGYYDATLSKIMQTENPPKLCGIGFNCQFLNEPLIVNPWDISLDYFLSETGIIEF